MKQISTIVRQVRSTSRNGARNVYIITATQDRINVPANQNSFSLNEMRGSIDITASGAAHTNTRINTAVAKVIWSSMKCYSTCILGLAQCERLLRITSGNYTADQANGSERPQAVTGMRSNRAARAELVSRQGGQSFNQLAIASQSSRVVPQVRVLLGRSGSSSKRQKAPGAPSVLSLTIAPFST